MVPDNTTHVGTMVDSNALRERVRRIFQYLHALQQHRSPIPLQMDRYAFVQWFHELPADESVAAAQRRNDSANEGDETTPREVEYVLRVRRPNLEAAPLLPASLSGWVSQFDNPDNDPVRHKQKGAAAEEDSTAERFDDDVDRVLDWQMWMGTWHAWAESEKPRRKALKLFERLFNLYTTLQREGEHFELVLGDGIVAWQLAASPIHHPLLLQSLQLDFEPRVPEFRLVETDRAVEFHSALFRDVDDVEPALLTRLESQQIEQGFHPLGGERTSEYFRSVAGSLSAQGKFSEDGTTLRSGRDLTIGRAPVIFLRDRAQGYEAFIQRVLALLSEEGAKISPVLANVVGLSSAASKTDESVHLTPRGEEPEGILLSKTANAEQILAAEYLQHADGVLVQGPPGTGKTHTIGNLLGHLLSEGRSVLVTSHTTKALRVLREQVVAPLRPLCVSVLDNETQSQNELQQAVQSIVTQLNAGDQRNLSDEADQLASRRNQLLQEVRGKHGQLLTARAAEYEDIILDGSSISPTAAAREVAEGRGVHDWIPQPVDRGSPLPLSPDEVAELYRLNNTIRQEDEAELEEGLPELTSVMTPDDFAEVITEIEKIPTSVDPNNAALWIGQVQSGDEDSLVEIRGAANLAVKALETQEEWTFAVVAAGSGGEVDERPWRDFMRRIRAVYERSRQTQAKVLEYDPKLGPAPYAEQIEAFDEIRTHLGKGGDLGWIRLALKPRWKAVIEASRVDGRPPSAAPHFDALAAVGRLEEERLDLRRRWDRFFGACGGPSSVSLGEEPEKTANQYAQQIEHLLEWRRTLWDPFESAVLVSQFRWREFIRDQPPIPGRHGELLRVRDAVRQKLIPLLDARINEARKKTLLEKLRQLNAALTSFRQVRVAGALRAAIVQNDTISYRGAHDRLRELWRLKLIWTRRNQLLTKLQGSASEWAKALLAREAPHISPTPPSDPAAAWRWRQFEDELHARTKVDISALQADLEERRSKLRSLTAELIEKRTWAAQVNRTGPAERQALMGYQAAVKRIGKGTGKFAPRWRAEAQRLLTESRTAVPAWIMPLSRVAVSFDPRHTHFDVVIIDEASQCDVMGLLAFFLADRVLVVGDDEQVSPVAVGQDIATVQRLIQQFLGGIPNSALYDGQMSIYELAQQSFQRSVRLVEHFRCAPDIIEFSNHLSYQGEIRPLRESASIALAPHVVEHCVQSGYEERKVNHVEAAHVASLVIAASEHEQYKEKTFGVISLLGDEQSFHIEKLLRSHLAPQIMQERRILCGNASQFQGDERDVIFLSVVKSRNPGGGPLALMSEGFLNSNKKRFNVAASRGRDQMWVVHSLNPQTDLKHGDLRLQLIQHARNPSAASEIIRRHQNRAESEFEHRVIENLVRRGFAITPQWWVGYYRIDLVVHGSGGKRVAIECDGDRFHPREKIAEDMARQAVLERLGWRFIRIRGTQYFRYPDETMESVYSKLESLGVTPGRIDDEIAAPTSLLIDSVRRRAAEIRNEWGLPDTGAIGNGNREVAVASVMDEVVEELASFSSPDNLERDSVDVADSIEGSTEDQVVPIEVCPICRKLRDETILFRGEEMCVECAQLIQREPTEPN